MKLVRFEKLDDLLAFVDGLRDSFSQSPDDMLYFFAAAAEVAKEREGTTKVDPAITVTAPAVQGVADVHAGVRMELVRQSGANGALTAYIEISRHTPSRALRGHSEDRSEREAIGSSEES